MGKNLLIFGGKSTAIEIAEVVKDFYLKEIDKVIFVIGDNEIKNNENQIFDSEIHKYFSQKKCNYIISFSSHSLRVKIENLMNEHKISPVNIIHPNAIISKTATLGGGNYIAGNTVVSANATIGNHNILNFNATIGHDTQIENHVIINSGARISGNVMVGSRVLIGANSFIFQGKKIGDDTLIDAMTYIDRDIDKKMICSSKQLNVFKRVIF